VATLRWSELASGVVSFDPETDVFEFDQAGFSAADVQVSDTPEGLTFAFGGKSVTLAGTSVSDVSVLNVIFTNGSNSVLFVGDGLPGALADDGDNGLSGLDGDDQLIGLGGSDVLAGAAGGDGLEGGAGFDYASYFVLGMIAGVVANLDGPTQNSGHAAGDTYSSIEGLVGSALDDVLVGNDAANELLGMAGDDYLQARDAVDTLRGGMGNDRLEGGAGADALDGGDGTDLAAYHYAPGAVLADLLVPAANSGDALGDGYIDIEGLIGSEGGDGLFGDNNANTLMGLGGGDQIAGRGGDDHLQGMDGNDVLIGGAGIDRLDGGAGTDNASYSGATARVVVNLGGASQNTGDALGDGYVSIEGIVGSSFNDVLVADDGMNGLQGSDGDDYLQARADADMLAGGNGSDRLEGGLHADTLSGGDGTDYAAYYYANAAVSVDLANPAANTGDAAGDIFLSIEGLIGSAHDDTVLADGTINHVLGLDGDDTIHGGGGIDRLAGMAGDDTLEGGAGADGLDGGDGDDTYAFTAGEANGDAIVNFSGNGALDGDSLLFRGYGAAVDGAMFVLLDDRHGQITSADGLIVENIAFETPVAIVPQDYAFV